MPTLNELVAQLKQTTAALEIATNTAPAPAPVVTPTSPTIEITSQTVIPPNLKLGDVAVIDAQANTVAIRKTMAASNRVDLPSGQLVQVDGNIRMADNSIIQSTDPNRPAMLQVIAGSPSVAKHGVAKAWYSVIQSNTDPTGFESVIGDTFGLPIGTANNATVRNLIIDAGYDQQPTQSGKSPTTCEVICLESVGAQVYDIVLRNVAKGVNGGECFPIRLFAPENKKVIETRQTLIRNCTCLHIGSAKSTHEGKGGDEITMFSTVGSKVNPLTNPAITNCKVIGLKRGPNQPSPINVFHTAYAVGADISDNLVKDSDATGYYQDTGSSRFMTISRNRFINVFRGIMLNAVTDFSCGNSRITQNSIQTFSEQPTWLVNGTPAAILLQKLVSDSIMGFNGLLMDSNDISAPIGNFGSQQFYARGLYIELRDPNHAANLVFCNNLVNVPVVGTGPFYPTWKSPLALYFTSTNGWLSTAPCLKAWNNRDSSGFLPAITVTDISYIPKLSISQA